MTQPTVELLANALLANAAETTRLYWEKVALEADNARLRQAIRKALEVSYQPGGVYRLLSEALAPGAPGEPSPSVPGISPPVIGGPGGPPSYTLLDDGYTVIPSYEVIHDDHPRHDP